MKLAQATNGTKEKAEMDICDWYVKGEPIKDILAAHGLNNDQALYNILSKYGIPLRRKPKPMSQEPQKIEATNSPLPPKREWFLLDECAVIVGMGIEDIEWLIRKGMVHAEESTTATGGKFTLVYLPSLMEAAEHTSIDGKRAKQLLSEAWVMIEKISRQKAVNVDDAKWITNAIADFFKANGWTLNQ